MCEQPPDRGVEASPKRGVDVQRAHAIGQMALIFGDGWLVGDSGQQRMREGGPLRAQQAKRLKQVVPALVRRGPAVRQQEPRFGLRR